MNNEPNFTKQQMPSSSSTLLVPWIKQENDFLQEGGFNSTMVAGGNEVQQQPPLMPVVQIKQEIFDEELPPLRLPPGPPPRRRQFGPKQAAGDGFGYHAGPGPSTSTGLDPRCRSGIPELAALWPVYVSNFCCPQFETRDQAIRSYFASKGLRVRWWFNRMDEYYFGFQLVAGLYDMLVYFESEQDAQQAILTCNRQYYHGHLLNVLPGRKSVFFPKDRSLFVPNVRSGRELELERHLRQFGYVKCVVQLDMNCGAVEMGNPQSAMAAQTRQSLWTLDPVVAVIPKQRYVEEDVLELIEMFLSTNRHVLEPIPNPQPIKQPKQKTLQQGQRMPRSQKLKLAKMNKWRRNIAKALDNGQKLNCHARTKQGKKQFWEMVQEVKQDRCGAPWAVAGANYCF